MINIIENNKQYKLKQKRLIDVSNGVIPDRVPVAAFLESYALAYANSSVIEAESSLIKHAKAYGKVYKDIYFDSAYVPCLTHSFKLGKALGSEVFFVSDDGITIQHKEESLMTPSDYENVIKDPLLWILNEFLPRKFPAFDANNLEQRKAFINTLSPFMGFAGSVIIGYLYFRKILGMPISVGGSVEMPLDFYFDFIRGFKGTTIDIRRNKEDLVNAKESIKGLCLDITKMSHMLMCGIDGIDGIPWFVNYIKDTVILGKEPKFKQYPWLINPCHIPPFLSDDQFEELYLDDYIEYVTYIKNHGGHTLSVLEGQWGEKKLEMIAKRVPDNSVIFLIENDDIFTAKRILGQNNCIMGGMPLSMLRDSTKSECVEYAKKLIDELSIGGRYIFSTDKVLISPGDVNVENLYAVNEFVHVYGKY